MWVAVTHTVSVVAWLVPVTPLGLRLALIIPFEMPIFFFASGATLYYSHSRQPIAALYLRRRLRRLLVPYALLALVCAGLFYQGTLAAGQPLTLDHLMSWLLLQPWSTVPVYVGLYIWFVPVMLAVSVAHVGLIRLFLSDRYRWPTAAFLGVGIMAFTALSRGLYEFPVVPPYRLPQYTVFYGAFVYLGYFYASGRLSLGIRRFALGYMACTALLLLLIRAGICSDSVQLNKFPPNIGLGVLGLSWVAFWLALQPVATALLGRAAPLAVVLRFVGMHSYTYYLCHGLGFWVADYALPRFHVSDLLQGAHYTLWMAIYFAFGLGFPTLIALATSGASAALRHNARRRSRKMVPA